VRITMSARVNLTLRGCASVRIRQNIIVAKMAVGEST